MKRFAWAPACPRRLLAALAVLGLFLPAVAMPPAPLSLLASPGCGETSATTWDPGQPLAKTEAGIEIKRGEQRLERKRPDGEPPRLPAKVAEQRSAPRPIDRAGAARAPQRTVCLAAEHFSSPRRATGPPARA
ncbi:MAG: hypothetical protein FJX68_03710 [Alphaproteobacteria bacterium]|nr:hypothetical protein [Alphaproteobacteria bacterium]